MALHRHTFPVLSLTIPDVNDIDARAFGHICWSSVKYQERHPIPLLHTLHQ
jgi:hypothetical protein